VKTKKKKLDRLNLLQNASRGFMLLFLPLTGMQQGESDQKN
jgi:hypothetical protein